MRSSGREPQGKTESPWAPEERVFTGALSRRKNEKQSFFPEISPTRGFSVIRGIFSYRAPLGGQLPLPLLDGAA
jgi:hypothetical protein